jgi:polysaccharide export outer membrane protein
MCDSFFPTTARRAPLLALTVLLAAASAAARTDYIVGPQDILTITVWEQPELSGRFEVAADGTITFPFIGHVRAGGRTTREVETALKKLLADGILRDPQLTVSVEQYRSQMIYLMGELRSPGSYAMTGEMTLVDALARAGSTTERAGGFVVVTRPRPRQPPEKIVVDLDELLRGVLSSNVSIYSGDTIFVPRADMCFLIGEVNRPGTYPIRSDTTILQAIALAGGLTPQGSKSRVVVIRGVGDKKQEIKAKPGDLVRPGDTIVVRERVF